MGVRGLTSYIADIETLWTQIELRNTKLIIDGSSLCNYLYKSDGFDCRYGGQYYEFYNAVLSFFDALDSKGVESFVILDGAQDLSGKNLDTHKKRAKERIETFETFFSNDFLLPLLSELVFIQALRDRDIRFAVCDSEADAEIASLANAWNCPVLSNDSDFFIFDIKAGYIPLSYLNWKSIRLTSKIFHRRKLASHFQIQADLLPLFATLAGNDYVSDDALEPFFQALRRIETLTGMSNWSRKEGRFATIASVLSGRAMVPVESVFQEVSRYDGGQLEQVVEHSLQEYTITESNLFRYFQDGVVCSSLRTQNDCEVDEWVLRRFREGLFSTNCMSGLTAGKVFLKAQVEKCQEVSANCCSQLLRQLVYGILNDAAAHNGEGNVTMAQEWDREGKTVQPTNVPPILLDRIYLMVKAENGSPNQEGVVLGASLIPRLNKKNRVLALLDALDSNTAYIKLLPKKFKLIAASLRFLVNNAQPMLEKNHLIALLCCCVTLEEDSVERRESAVNRKPSFLNVKAAQSFSQWQCVLRDAIDLNFILLEPLPTPCIHKTFNGRLVHYLREELDEGRRTFELPPSFSNQSFYRQLYNAVTDGLTEKLTNKEPTFLQNAFALILFFTLLMGFCFIGLSLLGE